MTIAQKLPALSAVANAVLKSPEGAEVVAKTLWASQPVAVLVLRRPGCGGWLRWRVACAGVSSSAALGLRQSRLPAPGRHAAPGPAI